MNKNVLYISSDTYTLTELLADFCCIKINAKLMNKVKDKNFILAFGYLLWLILNGGALLWETVIGPMVVIC